MWLLSLVHMIGLRHALHSNFCMWNVLDKSSQQVQIEHANVALQIQPSGKRFKLEEEKQKVKVEDGQIQEIVVSARACNPICQQALCKRSRFVDVNPRKLTILKPTDRFKCSALLP